MFISASLAAVGLLALAPFGQAAINHSTPLRLASAQGQPIALEQTTDSPALYRGSGR